MSLPSLRAPHAAADSDRALFARHYKGLEAFTDVLRDGRCRRTVRFSAGLAETLAPFGPLFMAWNTEILFVLYMNGALRFNAVKRALAPVSSRVLTDKLDGLVSLGFVERRPGSPGTYALTPRGEVVARHLHPLLFFLHTA